MFTEGLFGNSNEKRISDYETMRPVVLHNDPQYLTAVGTKIMEGNRKGFLVSPYMEDTLRMVAAAITIQAIYRAHHMRGKLDFQTSCACGAHHWSLRDAAGDT